jgi:nucleoside-diphosphate-sugar epimerase
MKILILGAAGMIGRKITEAIAADPESFGGSPEAIMLADIVPATVPPALAGIATVRTDDFSAKAPVEALVAERPDLIIHLASIVSGEAEADFEKGYRVNFDGTRYLLEAIRAEGLRAPYRPRLLFASSIAVYGAPLEYPIPDEFHLTPLTSYGTQKAMLELLLADYSRRGFVDGIGIRLPTICVRPGKPNKAASGFFSNIIREPLAGQEAVLPVDESVRHWFASPRAAVGFFRHAATLDLETVGPRINLSMPGVSCTVGEQIEALRRVAGEGPVKLIRRERDPTIAAIVDGWAPGFAATRGKALGFTADADFDAIIRAHIEDEMGGAV